MNKGEGKPPNPQMDYFDLLQVFGYDTIKNEKFIAKYFKGL